MREPLIAGLAFGTCLTIIAAHATMPARGHARVIPEPLAWQASAGPFTGNVKALVEGDTDTVFAWVDAEVFRSRDDGVSWIRCESQPLRPRDPVPVDRWLVNSGQHLHASGATDGPMHVSDDGCVSWRAVTRPPVPWIKRGHVTVIGGVLFAAYDGAASFASRDGGQTWIQGVIPEGIEPHVAATPGGVAYLVMSRRLYQSTDRGTTWSPLAPDGPAFGAVLTGGRGLYATASGGLWRSDDRGGTWERVLENPFSAVTVRRSRIYVSALSPAALARSMDDGRTWTRLPMTLPGQSASVLLETERGALLAATGRGIFRSTDAGVSWIATGVRGHHAERLVAGRGRAYASLADSSLWESKDSGATWSLIETAFAGSQRPSLWPAAFRQLLVLDDIARLRGGTYRELVASEDGGRTWSASGLSKGVTALVRLKNQWFAGTWDGVFRSDDMVRWQECSSGLQNASIRDLTATAEGDLIAIESFGAVYRSSDDCHSWWPLSAPPFRRARSDLARTPPLLASDESMGLVLFGDGITQLPRHQAAWILRAASPVITAFARDGQGRYWLGTREGVSRLSVEEPAWQLMPTGLDGTIGALAIDPEGYLLAAVDGRGIFRARLP